MAMILAGAARALVRGRRGRPRWRARSGSPASRPSPHGVRTADLGGHSGMREFTDEVIRRTRSKLGAVELTAAAGSSATANSSRKMLRDLRVELGAGAALDLGQRLFMGERTAVRPVARHRVEGVCDREHAGLERDLLACLPGRVARAVPALVVVEHVRNRVAQRGDAEDEPRAGLRVLADLRELVVVEAAPPCAAPRRRPRACRCRAAARRAVARRAAPRSSRASWPRPPRARSPGPSALACRGHGPRSPRSASTASPRCRKFSAGA